MRARSLIWIIIGWILIILAFWATVWYVVVHFIRKFW